MNAPSIVIVGAGMSGICAAIRLRDAGLDDITILERAQELGGTWRDNRYPGVACDVPSRSYTFSFAPNREWTQLYSPGSEIQDYFLRIADTGGVRSKIRFGQEVVEAAWEDRRWQVRTSTGDHFAADVLITATGVLHRWDWPDIPGLSDFGGDLVHTAAWPSDLELSGRRVGLIGVGATGAQVAPALAEQSASLTLFQRTPQWIMPSFNLRYGPVGRTLARRVPAFSRIAHRLYTRGFEAFAWRLALHDGLTRRFTETLCQLHLKSVKDQELRAKLTPDYQPGCKRMVMSGRFYRAVQRPNVDVVTEPIAAVDATGVRTADGTHHDLDVLVCATGFGFHAYLRPIRVVAPDRTTLEEAWADGPHAYNTVAMPGFPNFFMLVGPHSPVGSAPVIGTTEAQVEYVVECVRMLADGRADYLAPTRAATDAYNASIARALPATIWATGCTSYYLDDRGLPELWPWPTSEFRRRLGRPALEDFEPAGLRSAPSVRPVPPGGPRLPLAAVLASTKASGRVLLNGRVPLGIRRRLLDVSGDMLKPPAGSLVTHEDLAGIPAQRILPATSDGQTILLHLHGGGFVNGSARSYCGFGGHLAHHLTATAFVVDYRLAPEHPYPAAIEDALAAYRGLLERGYGERRIVISGDSAGGHVAVQVALRIQAGALRQPSALLLLCPWIDLAADYPEPDQDPLVTGAFLREAAADYLQGSRDAEVETLGASLGALPPTLLQTVPGDPTEPGAKTFANAARDAGCEMRAESYPGLWHDFQLTAGLLREADVALGRAGSFLRVLDARARGPRAKPEEVLR